jgi:hypothetical protein
MRTFGFLSRVVDSAAQVDATLLPHACDAALSYLVHAASTVKEDPPPTTPHDTFSALLDRMAAAFGLPFQDSTTERDANEEHDKDQVTATVQTRFPCFALLYSVVVC